MTGLAFNRDDGGPAPLRPFRLGAWRVDPRARELSDGARSRRLSPRAMAALLALVEAEGAVVSRADLMDWIWPDVFVGDESLTTAMSELRRALGGAGGGGLIETVPKAGYRLTEHAVFDGGHDVFAMNDESFQLNAYLLVLEARRLRMHGGPGSYDAVEALMIEASRIAPRYALAHAQRAMATTFRHLYQGGASDLEDALAAARTARRLCPELALGHAAEGLALCAGGTRTEARQALGRALSRDSSDFDTHLVAACGFYAMGDWVAATATGERAAMLNPDDCQMLGLAARTAATMGDMRRATALARRGLQRADARLRADPDEPRTRFARATLLSLLGEADAVEEALATSLGEGTVVEYFGALALARIGEGAAALDRLEAVIDGGWRHGALLVREPFLESLHGEPRFERLARLVTDGTGGGGHRQRRIQGSFSSSSGPAAANRDMAPGAAAPSHPATAARHATVIPMEKRMPLSLGDTAPDFSAVTTHGQIDFHDWIGDAWCVLFSHPKDFTPVCTTELGAMARLMPEFEKRGVKVIGFSVDPVETHQAWSRDIEETQCVSITYPLIADPDLEVAKLYGMLPRDASGDGPRTAADNHTVRSVFVIAPDKSIRLMISYPMTTGRDFNEILRAIDSLQLTATHKVATPANWRLGEDVIILPSVSDEAAREAFPDGWTAPKPYLRIVPHPA